MTKTQDRAGGVRERKRREIHRRIAEEGLRLFIAHGYEGTTIDAIAAVAGISRRTFFSYFKSKEEVLMAWQGGGFRDALAPTMRTESPGQPPLRAARHCLLQLVSRFETKESIVVDGLLRSTEALATRKKAVYVEMEQALLEGMCALWPDPARLPELRTAAMIALGLLRLANDDWRSTGGRHSLAHYLGAAFDTIEAPMSL